MTDTLGATKRSCFTVFLLITGLSACYAMRSFGIDFDNNTFVMDGKPFRYISGSIHYSRVPYQYWDDRLHKMAAAGLNAIQTYVPWNIHETVQGHYDFEGQQDVVKFIKTAQKYNLAVILRAGPYICAEWEFGGLPAWLLKDPDIKLRSSDPVYLTAVMTWMKTIYSVISPLLYKNGGPIISVQIENEYGSYPACDYTYLEVLRDLAWEYLGIDVVLFTTDGDGDGYLKCGTVNGVYATVDFGITYDPEKNFAIQRHKEPKGPLVNSEYYTGWLDHWGQNHSTVPTKAVAKSLDLMLALGANVNMYMFEGGTNFGFWNGAEFPPFMAIPTSYDYDAPLSEAGDITVKYHHVRNVVLTNHSEYIQGVAMYKCQMKRMSLCKKIQAFQGANYPFQPVPTSYDYDAPLTEAGDISDKYMQLRNTIAKYNPGARMKVPPSTPKYAYGKVNLVFVETLISYVNGTSKPVVSQYPLSMEDIDHYFGFILYEHKLSMAVNEGSLDLSGARDRAYVMVKSGNMLTFVGLLERDSSQTNMSLSAKAGDTLLILIENQGRINYGGRMNSNRKGLISNVTLNEILLADWLIYPVDLESDTINKRVTESSSVAVVPMSDARIPSVYTGQLKITSEPMDTYLDLSLWIKGQLFVNGMNMGRYWPHKGPQVRLFVPKFALKGGTNSITILELEKNQTEQSNVTFFDQPLINATVSPNFDHKQSASYLDRTIYRGNLTFIDSQKEKISSPKRQRSFLRCLYDTVMKVVESKWGILLL